MTETRRLLRCDCHGTEPMAEQVGNRLVIRKRDHGVVHTYTVVVAREPVLTSQLTCATDEGVAQVAEA